MPNGANVTRGGGTNFHWSANEGSNQPQSRIRITTSSGGVSTSASDDQGRFPGAGRTLRDEGDSPSADSRFPGSGSTTGSTTGSSSGPTVTSTGQGVRYVFNNNDDDDGWITIGSTIANFDQMGLQPNSGAGENVRFNLGGGNRLGGDGGGAMSFNINDFFRQEPEGAEPHPDDLPVEGEDEIDEPVQNNPPEAQDGQEVQYETQYRVQSAGLSIRPRNQEESNDEIPQQQFFHMRLGSNGEWRSVDDSGNNNAADNANNDGGNGSGNVQLRGFRISSSNVNVTQGGSQLIINTDDDDNGNFERWSNLTDHHAGLSKQQIESLPTRKLPARITEYDCPVCMEPMLEGETVRTLPCFHQMHVECVDPWLRRKKVCPFCRAEVKFTFDE